MSPNAAIQAEAVPHSDFSEAVQGGIVLDKKPRVRVYAGTTIETLSYADKRAALLEKLEAAVKETDQLTRTLLTGSIRDDIRSLDREETRRSSPYVKAQEALKEGGRSGVINFDDKEFYYWDGFSGRSLDEAKKLAVEIDGLEFDDQYISVDGLNNLLNPTQDNISAQETRDAFWNVMSAAGFKPTSLWNKVYPRGVHAGASPL